MCASATAILHWNAIPVFADIEKDTFNLDPESVIKNISSQTKAILAIDIFGHPCDIDALQKIADDYNLKLITDTAQSPVLFTKENLLVRILMLAALALIIISIFIQVKEE